MDGINEAEFVAAALARTPAEHLAFVDAMFPGYIACYTTEDELADYRRQHLAAWSCDGGRTWKNSCGLHGQNCARSTDEIMAAWRDEKNIKVAA